MARSEDLPTRSRAEKALPALGAACCALTLSLLAAHSVAAQTPPCGATLSTPGEVVVFDADMICGAGFTGTALTIAADGVTVDGAGFAVVAPDAALAVLVSGADAVTVQSLDVSGNSGTGLELNSATNALVTGVTASGSGGGTGIRIARGSGNLITGNTVHHRGAGIQMVVGEASTTIDANDLTDNGTGIFQVDNPRPGNNIYTHNDLSRSSAWGIVLKNDPNPTFAGNTFTDSANGLSLGGIDGLTLSGLDLSAANIPGIALELLSITNSTVSGIDASRDTGFGGTGIRIARGSGNLITGNTVHHRGAGIQMVVGEASTTIDANDLTDNGTGIFQVDNERPGSNTYTNNDLSRSSVSGITVRRENDSLFRDNLCNSCAGGIQLFGTATSGIGNTVARNSLATPGSVGILASKQSALTIRENTITGGLDDGLVLIDSADARIFHNNVFGNAGFQVTSDQPIELSFGNEGNYWGRACPDDLFVAGTDSNAVDVVDSFPFRAADAWLAEIAPGCGPPPTGNIEGTVHDGAGGVPNIAVNLVDSGSVLQAEEVTAGDGTYGFPDLEPGIYIVEIIVPIGYAPDSPTQVQAIVDPDLTTTVDFELLRLVLEEDTRSAGFWKHQVRVHLTGRGNAQETEAALLGYLADVQAQYDVFDAVAGLAGMNSVLDPPKPPTMRERAERQLMALLLNLASLRIATYTVVSFDDDAGEAIDFILDVLASPGSVDDDLEAAQSLADDINNGLLPLDPERVPEP